MEEVDSYRSFGVINDNDINNNTTTSSTTSIRSNNNISKLGNDVIGSLKTFITPYGNRPIVYSDWTASGRGLKHIESYIQHEVITLYGNTHTTTSITGHQSTCYRHESRQIIAQATNAKITGRAAEDIVIFTGNGTTAAVNKLVLALGLHLQLPDEHKNDLAYRPIVFTSSYEHHSNLLPWRESNADVVTIKYNHITGVCLNDLLEKLQIYHDRKVKIGSFSAASNVTGIMTDVNAVSILLHKAGGLVFFDYATAAPYVKMDMNPVIMGDDASYVYKDAIFFSGHKFIGGPGCPGVLIVKKKIMPLQDSLPTEPGGGTVFYVTEDQHRYLSNREEREEGGSPALIGDVKLGLVIHLKQQLNAQWIENEETKISKYAEERLKSEGNRIVLLGRPDTVNDAVKQLPIFSFLIRSGSRFLHHNFVCALLNDLFGIQSRGGCQCAGPFSQMLLGIGKSTNEQIELALLDKHEVLRPGYSRVSFTYWMDKEEVDYIIDSIIFVAKNGWRFLPNYRYNHKTGEWAHTTRLTRFPERKWISNFGFDNFDNNNVTEDNVDTAIGNLKLWGVANKGALFAKINNENARILSDLEKKKDIDVSKETGAELLPFEQFRWFSLPGDKGLGNCSDDLKGPIVPLKIENINTNNNDDDEIYIEKTPTAYALKRNEKLKSRHGGEGNDIPHYLTIFLNGSERIVKENDITDKSVLKKDTHTAAISNDNDVVKSKGKEKTNNLGVFKLSDTCSLNKFISSKISQKQIIDSKFSESKEKEPESLLSCSTGTCSFVQRAVTIPSNGDNKVISGQGSTYFPVEGIKPKFMTPPKKIMKLVGQAIKEWNMIEEGDRLLLGLSGGKDSLALLHVLLALQKRAPVKFTIACATVDPQTDSFDPSPLIPYVQSLGITYHYLSEPIVELAKTKLQGDSLCAFCSRFKRGLLYACCRNFKYNKLILAQHLDDLAESFMMSALHNGQIRTMKANYTIEAGDIRVIRPFIYVREGMTRDFSQESKLPIINENCPACFEQPKERARMKKLLMQEESMIPALYYNLRRAFIPLLHDDTYTAMDIIAKQVEVLGQDTRQRKDKETGRSKRQDKIEVENEPLSKRLKECSDGLCFEIA